MSALKSMDDLPKDGEKFDSEKVAMPQSMMLLAGGGAFVLFWVMAGIFYFFGGEERVMFKSLAYSWLFAVTFFLTLTVGGLFWTLLHNATNSGWGVAVRRLMENLGSLIPFMFVMALPMIAITPMRDALWEWFPDRVELKHHGDHELDEKFTEAKDLHDKRVQAANDAIERAKSENEIVLTAASAGEKHYLQGKVAALETVRAKLEAEAPTEESVRDGIMKHENPLLFAKRGYLNGPFWYLRFFLFAGVLTSTLYLLRHWSLKQDKTADPAYTRYARRWSCGFIALFAVCFTFLVVDWLMVLDYTWFSTMWGVYLFAGTALNSMALLIILLTFLRSRGFLKDVVTMEHYHIMGKLMLSFVIFWAYIAFSQFFLIWYANITEETKFYLQRNTLFFNTYTIVFLVIGHFFVPFLLLLMRGLKKSPKPIVAICVWNLLMHIADVYWIIIPERGVSITNGAHMIIGQYAFFSWAFLFDIIAFVGVGGLFGFMLLRSLGAGSLYPRHDPRLEESLNLTN